MLSRAEIASRQEVLLESYAKTLMIESLTMIDLVKKDILPAVLRYQNLLVGDRNLKLASGLKISTFPEDTLLSRIAENAETLFFRLEKLEADSEKAKTISDSLEAAKFAREALFEDMASLRQSVDELECLVAREIWPFPSYAEILYSVK